MNCICFAELYIFIIAKRMIWFNLYVKNPLKRLCDICYALKMCSIILHNAEYMHIDIFQ